MPFDRLSADAGSRRLYWKRNTFFNKFVVAKAGRIMLHCWRPIWHQRGCVVKRKARKIDTCWSFPNTSANNLHLLMTMPRGKGNTQLLEVRSSPPLIAGPRRGLATPSLAPPFWPEPKQRELCFLATSSWRPVGSRSAEQPCAGTCAVPGPPRGKLAAGLGPMARVPIRTATERGWGSHFCFHNANNNNCRRSEPCNLTTMNRNLCLSPVLGQFLGKAFGKPKKELFASFGAVTIRRLRSCP